MSMSPRKVQNSSLARQMMLTNMAISFVMPICMTDMAKPPSRPPNCRGRKPNMLAKSEVKASIRKECRNVRRCPSSPPPLFSPKRRSMKYISRHCRIRPKYSRRKLP